ncbi:hypothetical protein MOSE0_F00320 [Monosporozyma servazzii]
MQDCKDEIMELTFEVNGQERSVMVIEDPVFNKTKSLYEKMDQMQRDQALLFIMTVVSGTVSPLILLWTDEYSSQISQSMCMTNQFLLIILWGITLYLSFIENEIKTISQDNTYIARYESTVKYDKLGLRTVLLILGLLLDYVFQPILEGEFPLPCSFFEKMLLGAAGLLFFSPSAFIIPCFLIVQDLSHPSEPFQENITTVSKLFETN